MDTAMAILNNRFQIMAQYRALVIKPLVAQELAKADASVRHQFRRAKRLLSREPSLLQDQQQQRIDDMLAQSQALKVIYEKRLALQQIWARTSSNGHEMLEAIKQWVHEAEASGIQSLHDFAAQLKTYSLRPVSAT
jgi:transposase